MLCIPRFKYLTNPPSTKNICVRLNNKPWDKRDIKLLILKRERPHKKTNLSLHWAKFRKFLNKVISKVNKAKTDYDST